MRAAPMPSLHIIEIERKEFICLSDIACLAKAMELLPQEDLLCNHANGSDHCQTAIQELLILSFQPLLRVIRLKTERVEAEVSWDNSWYKLLSNTLRLRPFPPAARSQKLNATSSNQDREPKWT